MKYGEKNSLAREPMDIEVQDGLAQPRNDRYSEGAYRIQHNGHSTISPSQKNLHSHTKYPYLEVQNNRKRMSRYAYYLPAYRQGRPISAFEHRRSDPPRYQDLPDNIVFYLVEVYAYGHRLFITGILESGHTINIVANRAYKEIYFCLKQEYSGVDYVSEGFRLKAQKEIDSRLKFAGIQAVCEWTEKYYVFEIDGVPRSKRPYYKARYPFKDNYTNEPKADYIGYTYRYVFGTTYTPLELFIINSVIKGPCWVTVYKQYLTENKSIGEYGLRLEIEEPELIEVHPSKTQAPNLRVMSMTLRAIVPVQLKHNKKLFNTNRAEYLHIYAIGYTFCESYSVYIKPIKYTSHSRVFYLQQFHYNKIDYRCYIKCENEVKMIAQFIAYMNRHDPDIIICHDSSYIIDTLILRMQALSTNKYDRPRLGRFVITHELSKHNQVQRITSSLAGRLLADTYLHAKDMIKSVDYDLTAMSKHIDSESTFRTLADYYVKTYLNAGNTQKVLYQMKLDSECTFALMNHLYVLQITRQLSNICGIIWRRSLYNQRAERNEYLIMHNCFKRDLIIPDKFRREKYYDEDGDHKKDKYQGGYVIAPNKGLKTDFVLLLDFNSLYPSIIREYNVCFSIIKRPKLPMAYYYRSGKDKKTTNKPKYYQGEQQVTYYYPNNEYEDVYNEVVPPPRSECVREKWGFLPQLIDTIVSRRNQCKKAMKSASGYKVIILDIQQKCYKLVANSIYGCLGFSVSRFYSKHLAALITRMGRYALIRARDIVTATGGVEVIYGDTDSLMIQPTHLQTETDRDKLFYLKTFADRLKKSINQEYSNLYIDIDGIFKPLLLLMKKKYVARKLTNFDRLIAGVDKYLVFNIEYKGIEVVRRDGFALARNVLKKIIGIMMDGQSTDVSDVFEQIYTYGRQLNYDISKLPFEAYRYFLFSKQLNKSPKEYVKGGYSIPHVKVARDRIARGEKYENLINHTIYYLVCKGYGNLADHCFDDWAYESSHKNIDGRQPLYIDYEYYKRYLLQPIGRIMIHLKGFDNYRLAEYLGLDSDSRKKFAYNISIPSKSLEKYREEGYQVLEGVIVHGKQEKSDRFNTILSSFACKCAALTTLAMDGQLKLRCQCGVSLLTVLHNRMMWQIKQWTSYYYSNKYHCNKCDKKFMVTPIYPCCKGGLRMRSKIPFELHEMLYIGKDLCALTNTRLLKEDDKDKRVFEDRKKLNALYRLINNFLNDSDYEKVTSLFKMLSLC